MLVYDETVNQIRRELACKTVIEINLFVVSAVWERLCEWCAICHWNKELESENGTLNFTQLRKYSTQCAWGEAAWTPPNQNLTVVLYIVHELAFVYAFVVWVHVCINVCF